MTPAWDLSFPPLRSAFPIADSKIPRMITVTAQIDTVANSTASAAASASVAAVIFRLQQSVSPAPIPNNERRIPATTDGRTDADGGQVNGVAFRVAVGPLMVDVNRCDPRLSNRLSSQPILRLGSLHESHHGTTERTRARACKITQRHLAPSPTRSLARCIVPVRMRRMRSRFFTIPVPIPFRFHFGSDSKIFGSSSLYDSYYRICNLRSSLGISTSML